ncbi:unnamed protein product, partial [Polarella glacialis]
MAAIRSARCLRAFGRPGGAWPKAPCVTQLMAQHRWHAGQQSLNNDMPTLKHFRESATPHPLVAKPHEHLDPDERPIVSLMHNHVWTQEEIDLRLGNLYQHKPQSWSD